MPSRAKTPSPRKTKPKPKTRAGTAPSAEPATREPGPAPDAAAATEAQTAISASRGLADFLRTHRISFALTSYQTGQLMLIGVLPNGSLSVFQRNFVRAMGLWATPQTIHLSSIAQLWRLRSGDILHWLRFEGAVRELFDVGLLPGVRAPMSVGLASPEMRTLITLEGEAAPEAAKDKGAKEGAKIA